MLPGKAGRCLAKALIVMSLLWPAAARAAYTSARQLLDKPPEWYASEEAARAARAILSYQSPLGGWPKNVDTAGQPYDGDPDALRPTFDNSATTDELRFLARVFNATQDDRYRQAFIKGLDYILKAQYPNGGWPQSYPPPSGYGRHITFNDGAMVRLMFFVREVATDDARYAFVDPQRRSAARQAWDRGIDCILKCQIKVDGKLTAWCAQHDEKDFSPRPARAFEPASISGCETIGIVHALMAVQNPGPEIIAAVDAAYEWLNAVKIPGIRVEDRPQEGTPRGHDRFVVPDPSAEPMWARFYEIGTNRPIFADRDGVVKYDLREIGIERRTGYQWLKYWPKNFVSQEYPQWKAKVK